MLLHEQFLSCSIAGGVFKMMEKKDVLKYNSLLNNCQHTVGSHQKQTPHIQGQRRSSSKMVRGKIAFRIKPHAPQ